MTGTGSLVQPVQWSGEMHDEEPALVYYNYRYYNPKDGRWINRDPIAEEGGVGLYAFLGNSTQDKFDALGLKKGVYKNRGSMFKMLQRMQEITGTSDHPGCRNKRN